MSSPEDSMSSPEDTEDGILQSTVLSAEDTEDTMSSPEDSIMDFSAD